MATVQADRAKTQYVDGASARFAYRRFGPRAGVPLIMALRLRGAIDHGAPVLLDVLSAERDVIAGFDRLVETTSTALALYEQILARYPDRVNPGMLWGSARALKPAAS